MGNVVEEKLRLFKGFVGTAVTVACRSCVSVCDGWVITIECVCSCSLVSSSFSLPLVDYVGVVTILRLNGGSVGP